MKDPYLFLILSQLRIVTHEIVLSLESRQQATKQQQLAIR